MFKLIIDILIKIRKVVVMGWLKNRKLKKMLKELRTLEINEINSYMDQVYNPRNVVSKPKYRQKESIPQDEELTRHYIHMVYDPPIMPRHKKDHTLNEYMKGET